MTTLFAPLAQWITSRLPFSALPQTMPSLIGGNGEDVNGQHEVSREIGQLGDHFILDVAGIVPQKQDAPHLAAHLKVVRLEA